jgi:hypothetical protein
MGSGIFLDAVAIAGAAAMDAGMAAVEPTGDGLAAAWTGKESWLAAAIVASAEHGGSAHSQVVTPTSARSTLSNGGYMSLRAIVKKCLLAIRRKMLVY